MQYSQEHLKTMVYAKFGGQTECIMGNWKIENRPFAASHSRGTKPPCWRAKVALGQDKQRKLPFKIMYVFCLSCPSATFALQRGGFVPREWLAAKSLLSVSEHNIHSFQLDVMRTWQFQCGINSILEIIINYHGQLYPLVAWATGASGEIEEERSETGARVKGRIN